MSSSRIAVAFLLLLNIESTVDAQTATITTVAGISLAETRVRARDIAIGLPYAVAADGKGGVYFSGPTHGMLYHASRDGALSVIAGQVAGYPQSSNASIGDRGKATDAQLRGPTAVVVDQKGSVFIADDNRIRRITPDGIIDTIAGNGRCTDQGDGGPATLASVCKPMGMAFDLAGNLFIAEAQNNRIRRVTPNGQISTVAGNGQERGPLGDGGPALRATLIFPTGVAFDRTGNLYIADSGHYRVRKVSTNGQITTVAGNGREGSSGDGGLAESARLYAAGVAVDAEDNLFIADANRIRKVTTKGIITTVAGTGASGLSGDGGPAVAAQIATMDRLAPLEGPIGIAVDPAGTLLIADKNNYRIRSVAADGTLMTLAGNGTAGFSGDGSGALSAQLYGPGDVIVDNAGNIYIADSGNDRVRKVSEAGVITTVAGTGQPGFSGDGGPATSAQLRCPSGLALDAPGNLYIVDSCNSRIRKVTPEGVITTVAGNGALQGPAGDGGPGTSARLVVPTGIALNATGELFIAEDYSRIRKVDRAGLITTIAGTGRSGHSGDGGPAVSAQIAANRILIDRDGNVLFAESNGIRRITPAGTITRIVGSSTAGGFNGENVPALAAQISPRGMAIGPDANVYFADSMNHRIRKVTRDGTVVTVAGIGDYGFKGDNGPAVEARLGAPTAIAFDRAGNLFIADSNNNRIRKITFGK